MAKDEVYEELRKKYVEKLQRSLNDEETASSTTRQYEEFRAEAMPKPLTLYEKWCNLSEKLLKVAPDKKKRPELERAIAISHLKVTPEGTASFAIVAPMLFLFAGILLLFILPSMIPGVQGSLFVAFYVAAVAAALIIPLGKIPLFLANTWRMQASNQMVLCIFYIVTYMRHTSNLELAIDFAAEHLSPPLSLDMKKVIWDLETGKYESLRESLEAYLETWRKWNDEFIQSMHLIESSLVETTEERRVESLEKGLAVMLDETYEKMLHYAHNLKGPLTTLHMLGIILPILGLVILPLMVAFTPTVQWFHLALLYNVTLPVLVYFLGKDILSKRPTGYGSAGADEQGQLEQSFLWGGLKLTPFLAAFVVFALFFFIGIIPLLMHAANPDFDLATLSEPREGCLFGFCRIDPNVRDDTILAVFWFNEYREITLDPETKETAIRGPFGIVATLLSLLIPLGVGLSAGLYYKLQVKDALKKREAARKLELEFASALFQLGNRLGDGLPLEIAFSKVAAVMPDTPSGAFFIQVSNSITRMGLSVEDALFHEKYGAINDFPSNIIESSMKVLVESAQKGPIIASQAIINVSNYIKEMHRVDERLKDLMADVISSMRSQISFLTPTIAGVVIGITSMITSILGSLGSRVQDLQSQTGGIDGAGVGSSLMSTFSGAGVPTYWFQIVVGLYVVQIVFVLSILVNGIENGSDKTGERAMLADTMIHSTVTYICIAFALILLFNIVAASIVPTGAG